MTDKTFNLLFSEALAASSEEMYIAEMATSSIFDPDPDGPEPDYDKVVNLLAEVWRLAHLSAKDIRKSTGLTQVEFADRYCVNYNTVRNWETKRGSCPDYVRLLFIRLLGLADNTLLDTI